MSLTSVRVVLDSCSPAGVRLTTIEATFPRFLLPELATHRRFSKNLSSSRAIPVKKLLDKARYETFIPEKIGFNQSGMQAENYFIGNNLTEVQSVWLEARDEAIKCAEKLLALNVHKQTANRLLEPFLYCTAIISSIEWDNFFNQRLSKHGMAQPEIGELADKIYEALEGSVPKEIRYHQWHTPFIQDDEQALSNAKKMKLSVSRAARTSYLSQNGIREVDEDYRLFERLLVGKHNSPFEHVATPDSMGSGNFTGAFTQLRYYLENNTINDILELNS